MALQEVPRASQDLATLSKAFQGRSRTFPDLPTGFRGVPRPFGDLHLPRACAIVQRRPETSTRKASEGVPGTSKGIEGPSKTSKAFQGRSWTDRDLPRPFQHLPRTSADLPRPCKVFQDRSNDVQGIFAQGVPGIPKGVKRRPNGRPNPSMGFQAPAQGFQDIPETLEQPPSAFRTLATAIQDTSEASNASRDVAKVSEANWLTWASPPTAVGGVLRVAPTMLRVAPPHQASRSSPGCGHDAKA